MASALNELKREPILYGGLAAYGLLAAVYRDRSVFTSKRDDFVIPYAKPLIGSSWKYLFWLPLLHDAIANGFRDTDRNTFVIDAICIPHMIATCEPANVEHILKNNFENYIKGPQFNSAMDSLFGHGIFNANGEEWKYQRKTASHIFNVKNFRDQFTEVFIGFMNYISDNILEKAAEENRVIDFHALMYKYTLDAFVKLGFGTELKSLESEEKNPFAAAFDEAQKGTFFRIINQSWPATEGLFNFIAPWVFPDMKNGVKVVDKYAEEIIEQRRKEMANGQVPKDLLSRFMHATNAQGQPLNNAELRDIVLNFVIAGRDTTAQALSWCFYMLSLHPRVEQKLYEEIQEHMQDEHFTDPAAIYEVIKTKMLYAHAVFFETLRLYPSVPMNQKYALGDDVWPDGTVIKKGDYVVWSPYAQGRNEKVWGPDAKQFRPERWFTSTGELKRESQGQWPAFHGGPRVCLGQALATLEALVAMTQLVRKFHFTLQPGQDVAYQISLTLPMKNGLKLSVQKRKA